MSVNSVRNGIGLNAESPLLTLRSLRENPLVCQGKKGLKFGCLILLGEPTRHWIYGNSCKESIGFFNSS